MQKLRLVNHPLLTESVLKLLAQSRITTLLDFLQEDTEKISTICKLNISQVLAIRNHIFNTYSAPVITGTSILQKLLTKNKNYIETGIINLDTILNGGLPVGLITEIFGLADSGKTQLCFQIATNCVKNMVSTVLYIDTKGDFSAIRLQKMLASQGLSHQEMASIMHKIKVAHIWTMEELIELFQSIKNKTIHFVDLSIIIVDSLPSLMFQFLGDNNKIGLAFLNKFVNYCRFLCTNMNLVVICVNIQTRWVEQDLSDLEDDREQSSSSEILYLEKQNRCLGNYWCHVPALLLLLEKSNTVDDSSTHNISVTSLSSFNRESKKCILKLSGIGISS